MLWDRHSKMESIQTPDRQGQILQYFYCYGCNQFHWMLAAQGALPFAKRAAPTSAIRYESVMKPHLIPMFDQCGLHLGPSEASRWNKLDP